MRAKITVAFGLLVLLGPASASTDNANAVHAYTEKHRAQIVDELLKLAAIPDLHGNAQQLNKNVPLLMDMMARRGLHPEEWSTTDGIPELFGEKTVPGAKKTLLFYIHYDGQPVDPKRWQQPDPFVPVLRTDTIEAGGKIVTGSGSTGYADGWRIYGRAAADDKGPIISFLNALDAIGGHPKENIKLILDGEEEGGGTALREVVAKYPEKLHSDVLIILDGPQHNSGKTTMFYGARGGTSLRLTVYTAKQGLHSGNYGNWMPDANIRLAQLISSMVDADGKSTIPGFYSDVLPFDSGAIAIMKAVPDDVEKMRAAFGVGSTDKVGDSFQQDLNLPTFSVHTMQGGELGGVIPASASADIQMRLVKENDPKIMVDRVINQIRAQGYLVLDRDPDVPALVANPKVAKVTARLAEDGRGSGAWRTDPANPEAVFVYDAVRSVAGNNLVRIRTLGGTVPATPFIDAYHVPVVGISLANFDDNQHTDNENLRIGNLLDGVNTLAAIMKY
ncbi:MAG TPA: M20/M25/M40 family metallo-hydrolase [Rhizomicrobium sp.]|jgi:acetylornithine deacetylase/succinyl-diaminopimelate desuccinylase-like protein|nr:M20/M25/M40 family metallo-hydrolase [Rhizomicrobium sp.]